MFEVCSSKFMAANLLLLLKVVTGQRTGRKHLTSLSGMCSSVLPLPVQCCSCARKRSVL